MKSIYITLLSATAVFSFIFLTTGDVNAIECKDKRPAGPPVLYEAVTSEDSVTLSWQPAPDPVTYYLVRYGVTKENLEYGLPNIGGRDTTSFTVSGLLKGQKYYFQVRAGNGCKPGEFSNTLTATVGQPTDESEKISIPNLSIYKEVLGASDSAETQQKGEVSGAVSSSTRNITHCAFSCQSLPIIISELIALLLFYLGSLRYQQIKPYYSLIIPIVAIGSYYYFHGTCTPYAFFCRYFIPITVISYLFAVLIMKNRDHFRHSSITKT